MVFSNVLFCYAVGYLVGFVWVACQVVNLNHFGLCYYVVGVSLESLLQFVVLYELGFKLKIVAVYYNPISSSF